MSLERLLVSRFPLAPVEIRLEAVQDHEIVVAAHPTSEGLSSNLDFEYASSPVS